MTHMTKEEKAKAYDEAMNKIKPLYEQAKRDGNPIWSTYEYLIPELAESEDEKIRKELLEEIEFIIPHEDETDSEGLILPSYRARIDRYKSYIEKQEDKERLDRMAPIYNNKESFEFALEKAWKYYNECDSRTVESLEGDSIECVFSKGFREGYLYKAIQKEQKPEHFELKEGRWYICHHAYCCRADSLTVKEGERFMCEKDGVVKGFVIKEPEKYFIECSAPAPMEDKQKEQKPTEWSDTKIKEMKVNELMIGYWMCTDYDSTPRQIDWIGTGEVCLIWNKVVTPSYLVPIPITSEILEKNGFESDTNMFGLCVYELSKSYILENRGDRFCFVKRIPGHMHSTFHVLDVKYIHELQNALRLCGIEKEIEL